MLQSSPTQPPSHQGTPPIRGPEGVINQEDHAAPEPTEVLAVREILLSLNKALKASRVYSLDNPAYQKLLQEYAHNLTHFLETRESMVWDIAQFLIKYEGESVYENRDPSTSLAFHLYKDGLRQLRFFPGLDLPEAQEFFDILRSTLYEPDADDDLATLFWEKDLPSIEYLVADAAKEGDEGGEFDFRSLSQSVTEHGMLEQGSHPEQASPDGATQDFDILKTLPISTRQTIVERIPIFLVQEQEIGKIKEEMVQEGERDLGQEFLDLLLEIISAKEEIEGYKEILAIIARVAESYCQQGDFGKAFHILRDLEQLANLPLGLPETRRASIQEAIKGMGSPDKLKGLAKILNRSDEGKLRAFQSYVSLLGSEAIMPLCELLGELEQMKSRRLLCEIIAQIAEGHVEKLAPSLRDRRWFVLRNIAYILGLMKDPQGVKYLKDLVEHHEPRVAKEAIRGLGVIGDAPSREHLLASLQSDRGFVQVTAARVLANIGEKRAIPLVLQIIEQRQFIDRDREEKMEVFEALGRLGSEEILPMLKNILLRTSFLRRQKLGELREGAAAALAFMGTQGAMEILKEAAKNRDRSIAQASRSALSHVFRSSKGTQEEGSV